MNYKLRLFLIVAIFTYFAILFYLIKRKTLNLKYSLLWIFSGLGMLIVVIFPKILEIIIRMLGVRALTNGLFSIVLFFILIILMSITAIVSKMKEDNKKLIQEYALLEKRFRKIEKEFVTEKYSKQKNIEIKN